MDKAQKHRDSECYAAIARTRLYSTSHLLFVTRVTLFILDITEKYDHNPEEI
jgi:hypothetical protein